MSQLRLDHLTPVDPRSAWPSESGAFTPWLAEEENFRKLADTLHLSDAEVEATEKAIGSFSADIVARDRDGYVLIENQLEQTDHVHLGQIITYLAGLDGPAKVVWIATKIREEHRAAVDWLNAHTPDDFSFFAVELELYRIGESPAAPYFHVAARPNEWSRHVGARTRQLSETALTDLQRQYMAYWNALADFIEERDPSFRRGTPPKDSWWNFTIGRSYFTITLLVSARDQWIGVELFCHKDADKLVFDHFHAQKEQVEAEFGDSLDWERLDGRKGSRIAIRWRGVDPLDADRWSEYFEWYWHKLQRFRKTFTRKVRELDVEALAEGSDEPEPAGDHVS